MNTKSLLALLTAALVAAVLLSGCASGKTDAIQPSPPADSSSGASSGDAAGGAAGSQLAPGLYDVEGGKVQAIGNLEYRDLEGGFWAVTDTTQAEGGNAAVVAVIANGADFDKQLQQLKGTAVVVVGKRLEGASIRMAGPEIEMESVSQRSDASGAAE